LPRSLAHGLRDLARRGEKGLEILVGIGHLGQGHQVTVQLPLVADSFVVFSKVLVF